MSTDTKFHVHHDAPEVVGRRERLGVRLLIVADGAFLFGMMDPRWRTYIQRQFGLDSSVASNCSSDNS
jgi:hypothetical protein